MIRGFAVGVLAFWICLTASAQDHIADITVYTAPQVFVLKTEESMRVCWKDQIDTLSIDQSDEQLLTAHNYKTSIEARPMGQDKLRLKIVSGEEKKFYSIQKVDSISKTDVDFEGYTLELLGSETSPKLKDHITTLCQEKMANHWGRDRKQVVGSVTLDFASEQCISGRVLLQKAEAAPISFSFLVVDNQVSTYENHIDLPEGYTPENDIISLLPNGLFHSPKWNIIDGWDARLIPWEDIEVREQSYFSKLKNRPN